MKFIIGFFEHSRFAICIFKESQIQAPPLAVLDGQLSYLLCALPLPPGVIDQLDKRRWCELFFFFFFFFAKRWCELLGRLRYRPPRA
jgi:hypothetical protein